MRDRYQVITFDVGLTLVAMDSFTTILCRVCQDLGLPADPAVWDRAVDDVWADVMRGDATTAYEASEEASRAWWRDVNLRTFARAGLPRQHWEAVESLFMAGVDDPASYSLFPDSIPTLAALRTAGYRLGLISNWGWNLPELCESWGLASRVDFITASARVGYAKPNRRIFEAALQQAGTAASGMLHVGDSHYADVGGARGAGIDAILVNRDSQPAPTDCHTVADLRELLPLLALPPAN